MGFNSALGKGGMGWARNKITIGVAIKVPTLSPYWTPQVEINGESRKRK